MSDHYSEAELAELAAGLIEDADRAVAIQDHLSKCNDCRRSFDAIRSVDEVLREENTWLLADPKLPRETILSERILALLTQAAAEDDQAIRLIGSMIGTPAAIAFAGLPAKKKYHSAGVVRLLCRASHELLASAPSDALLIANSALAVAEALPHTAYPPTLRHTLIGTASKKRANALRYLGDYGAAQLAFDHAEREFRDIPHAEIELARIQFGRATVYEKSEKRGFRHRPTTGFC